MTTLLDDPATSDNIQAGQRLRASMAAVRVMFTWFGTRKSLSAEQKAQALTRSAPRATSSLLARS